MNVNAAGLPQPVSRENTSTSVSTILSMMSSECFILRRDSLRGDAVGLSVRPANAVASRHEDGYEPLSPSRHDASR